MPFSEVFSIEVLIDMKRELSMLFVAFSLYLAARCYNDYLDRQEALESKQD